MAVHSVAVILSSFGHISSSKAGFVLRFERREQFRRSVFFFVGTYREMASFPSVVTKKAQTYQNSREHFRSFAPIARFPKKMTYGNMFIFVFLWSRSGWP